ncbi:MAG TPA: hypothetical protein PK715_12235, partial [Chitinophagales bacterium]|nr:hypothetical protein [Chitinophagales bacterium]
MLLSEEALLQELLSIEGNGSFTTTGVKNFVQPGLYITDIGDVGLPLSKAQAQELIAYAKQAPYGKGLQTLTNTTVRSTWEIDAKKVAFQNEAWKPLLKEVIKEVKNGLGLNNTKIKPKLYKLLIYQTGDFFLPHKDSEKEKGMFGTLVISLPSEHTGGELEVEFGGVKNKIDFSKIANKF